MVIEISSEQHVKLKAGLFYAICVFLIVATAYVVVTVQDIQSSIHSIQVDRDALVARVTALENAQFQKQQADGELRIRIAIIETRLGSIEQNTLEIKNELRKS